MCGIVGLLSFDAAIEPSLFKKITRVLSHRGPDDEGFLFGDVEAKNFIPVGSDHTPKAVYNSRYPYSPAHHIDDFEGGKFSLALGNRRLAILDVSSAGHQPMANEEKTIWIVYNGEVYNYIEIREELEAKGYKFFSNSDTEVIIKAYEEWGHDCLNKFNGMWAFCIWDVNKRELFCARDRLGIKPFYYNLNKSWFGFASEIKSLLPLIVQKKSNDRLVYDFVKFGVLDHTDATLFEEVKKLPQAHYLVIDHWGNFKVNRYWDVSISNTVRNGELDEKHANELGELFSDAVRLRLRSDVPIGSCLSGGIDSSSIVCVANRLMGLEKASEVGARQKTFSSCSENRKYDEREYIDCVINKTRAEKNYVFPSASGFMDELDQLLWHQEEPFNGTGVYAQWSVLKRASERGVVVMLDGQGGDELLAGYRKFYFFYFLVLLRSNRYLMLANELARIFTSMAFLKTLKINNGLRYFDFGSKLLNVDDLLSNDFKGEFKNRDIQLGFSGNLGSRMENDLFKFSLPALLRYEDKNSMAHSVETRLPFLDYRVVAKIASLPLSQKMQDGWTKYVLRNAMKDILPDQIRLRKTKLGFSTPEDWFRSVLKEDLRKTFEDAVFIKSYVNQKKLRDVTDNYIKNGNKLVSNMLFRLFICEHWARKFLK